MPTSRAESSHEGSSCSTAAAVASVTTATPIGSVVQIQTIQSGKPLHDSRLTPEIPALTTANGHGQGRGTTDDAHKALSRATNR